MDEVNLIRWLLKEMESIKDHVDRDKFCPDFDKVYEHRKELYRQYTGEEWGISNA